MDQSKLKELAVQLFDLQVFKFRESTGTNSPFYLDIDQFMSHPHIMSTVSDLLTEYMKLTMVDSKVHLCSVSYTALPVVSLVSVKTGKSILPRKQVKTYGTKQQIEGKFSTGDKCLIYANVVSCGTTVLQTAKALRAEGLVVTDAIAIVDSEMGGLKNTEQNGIRMHSLFTLSFILKTLHEAHRIEERTVLGALKFSEATQLDRQQNNDTKIAIPDDKNSVDTRTAHRPIFFIIGLWVSFHLIIFVWRAYSSYCSIDSL
ncbi:uridine 5'-monophosphate synthase-like [Sabethes cyaneus]|uniref:uridine 5'-monophosphate synthase-like n=1 Tax=Sabethes cyaneus TaxID=53552 RepID=UPI00237DAADB|nr:uridine 5'-monophosphate synthase-like [Sabethes cyaneus]